MTCRPYLDDGMSHQLNGNGEVFGMETLRWVTNHLIFLFWKVRVPFWTDKVVSQKEIMTWKSEKTNFIECSPKKRGDGRFTVPDKKLQPYRAWYWSLKCWTSHVLETLGSTCRTHPEAILIKSVMLRCSIVFLTKSVTYQGWGWSPIMTRYQGNPAISPGVQLPKVSQTIRCAIQVAFVGRPYSYKATECSSNEDRKVFLLHLDNQRGSTVLGFGSREFHEAK